MARLLLLVTVVGVLALPAAPSAAAPQRSTEQVTERRRPALCRLTAARTSRSRSTRRPTRSGPQRRGSDRRLWHPERMANQGQSVLVVEDESSIASFVALYLKNAGYRIEAAGTGRDALERVASEKSHLL